MIDVSRFVETLGGRPVAVFGLGVSNRAVIRALVKAGAAVWAWDDQAARRDEAAALGAEIVDLGTADLSSCACLVLAPGVPLHYPSPHPVAARAREAGIEILCDLEILHRSGHGRKMIGITGTNGKSTTTALTGFVLDQCGKTASVGGNIGTAALDLDMPPPDGAFVLEISSYQLDLCPTFAPDIAVHLNLTPDHLDRHGTMENYYKAKKALFRGAVDAVIAVDDEPSRRMAAEIEAAGARSLCRVSVSEVLERGVYVADGRLHDRMAGEEGAVFDLDALPALQGVHNHQNAAASYAAARLAGCAPDQIYAAMTKFPGLAHRQFTVRTLNGVAYINDSKATNAAATAWALAARRDIYWIAGGLPKEGGLDGLEPYMDRVHHAFLIGQAEAEFADWLSHRRVAHTKCGTLDQAVAEAHYMAQREKIAGATVLLSPACASFDQFRSFEERGDHFAALVEDLKEDAA